MSFNVNVPMDMLRGAVDEQLDLMRENKFLRLQLKIMNDIVADFERNFNKPNFHTDLCELLGSLSYYSDLSNVDEKLEFIKKHNEPYNFYNRLMSVD